MFVRQDQLGPVIILLYVDDFVIAGVDLDELGRVKLQLAASFDMKDLGDLHYFLEIEVIRTPEGILIAKTPERFATRKGPNRLSEASYT